MAARPGEENVATLFADVHYFYGSETAIPPHHRFNKGSYVYLFENAQDGRARIEVANNPGTEHQDAFDGFLDHTNVKYSYKHSCMVSLTVNTVPNMDEWHLPTYDPSNQQIYHYKLESVDIYFWTHLDALQFVNGVRRVLPPFQVDIQDEPPVPAPPPPPQQPRQVQQVQQVHANNTANMSSVVQKLESVALGGVAPPPAGIPTFAAPPMSTQEEDAGSQTPSPPTQSQSQSPPPPPPPGVKPTPQPPQQAFAAPFVYNPAAPPAPEIIRPREKTPPPEDAPAQHPLHQTLYQDAATPFSPGLVVPAGLGPLSPGIPPPQFHAPPGAPSFPAPPAYTSNPSTPAGLPQQYQQFPVAPQQQPQQQQPQQVHPGIARATTMPVPGSAPSPFSPVTTLNSFSPPPATGSAPATSAAATAGPGANPYLVHQQHYQPQAGEVHSKYQSKQEPRGKLEETAGRLEKGMTGMLKKFEKRFG